MDPIERGDLNRLQFWCVHMQCQTCGHDAGWLNLEKLGLTIGEAKRGLPCPKCNPPESA